MQEIYDSRESASTFEVQFRDISQFVQQESTFLEVLNQVIVSYVEVAFPSVRRALQSWTGNSRSTWRATAPPTSSKRGSPNGPNCAAG